MKRVIRKKLVSFGIIGVGAVVLACLGLNLLLGVPVKTGAEGQALISSVANG